MRRALTGFAATCLGVLAFVAAAANPLQGANSAKPLSKKDAAALIQNAVEHSKLTESGNLPFHLMTRLSYSAGGKIIEGSYELLWASPEKYREEFRLGEIGETDVALTDKLYILRNTSATSLALWRARISIAYPLMLPSKLKIKKVISVREGGIALNCVETSGPMPKVGCFDAQTGEIVSVKTGNAGGGFLSAESDFVNFASRRYPRQILRRYSRGTFMEITVIKLETASSFAANAFTPPSGATAQAWCASPDVIKPKEVTPPFQLLLVVPGSGITYISTSRAYYLAIGIDGRVEKEQVLESAGKQIDDEMAGYFKRQKFAIHLCGGKPIPYEDIWNWEPVTQSASPVP